MNKAWIALTALVIEDDKTYSQLITSLLESAGFKTTITRDGSSGIEAYRLKHFDVVVCDLMLPDMLGCDVIQILRAHTSASSVVIALTGSEDKVQMERAIDSGADDLYNKSIGPHVLRAKFSSLAHRLADEQREKAKIEEIEENLSRNIADLQQCGTDRIKEINELRDVVEDWIKQPPILKPEQIEYIATVAAQKATEQAAELAAEKAVEIMRRNFELELGRSVLNKGAIALGGLILAAATYAAGKGWIQP